MGEGIAKFNMNLGISFPKLYMNLGIWRCRRRQFSCSMMVEMIFSVCAYSNLFRLRK